MDEKYLIENLRKQNKIVFDFIFQYYYPGLCIFAKHYTGSIESAEDIVQDFFVSLWIKAPHIVLEYSLKSYLFTSVKNRCLDHLKHERVKEKFQDHILKETEEPKEELYNLYVESELRQAIHQALEKIPPQCRKIFIMSRMDGKSNQDIADLLGLSKRTVELQISNALSLLRNYLKNFISGCLIALIVR